MEELFKIFKTKYYLLKQGFKRKQTTKNLYCLHLVEILLKPKTILSLSLHEELQCCSAAVCYQI